MILSFKPQFVEPILKGTKIHTIREDSTDRWKAGNSIQCATGVRTKNYNCFFESECVSTQTIEIKYLNEYLNDVEILIDGVQLALPEKQKLAWADGFLNLAAFLIWFNQDFKGKIIHWTDFRY